MLHLQMKIQLLGMQKKHQEMMQEPRKNHEARKKKRVLYIAPDGKNIKLEKFVKAHRSLKRHAPQEDAKPHKSLARMLIQKAKNALKRKQSGANLEDELEQKDNKKSRTWEPVETQAESPPQKKPSGEIPTNDRLQTAIQRCLGPSWTIRVIEAGGGGDCFFLSVAAALQRMMAAGDPYRAHVLSKVPRAIAEDERATLAAHLRKMVALRFADMEPEQLMNELRTFSMCQQNGLWPDSWSPVDLLANNHLQFLNQQNIDVVVGIEDAADGDAGDYRVGVRMADGSYEYFTVAQGSSMMRAALEDLQNVFSQMGNVHWATEADVARLAVSLDIGFFLFCEEDEAGHNKCLYSTPLGTAASTYSMWVSLRYVPHVHFQLAELRKSSNDRFACFWQAQNLPTAIIGHWAQTRPEDPVVMP